MDLRISEANLHYPDRINNLLSLESHLSIATSMSRGLWLILINSEDYFTDIRNYEAILSIADNIADHASAAKYLYGFNFKKDGSTTVDAAFNEED